MQRSLLTLAIAATTIACFELPQEQICNQDVTAPGCNVSQGPGEVAFRIVTDNGDRSIQGICGQFAHFIQWSIPGGAPSDGAIVQRIRFTGSGNQLDPDQNPQQCVAGDLLDEEFWELWPISAGQEIPDRFFMDQWAQSPHKTFVGDLTFDAEASFYSDAEMAGVLGRNLFDDAATDHPFAVDLPSTTTPPPFWADNPKPRLERKLGIDWTCCPQAVTNLTCAYFPGANPCN